MQADKSRLSIRLLDSVYAIETQCVREVMWLPELTAIEETPPHIAGVFNLRGHIVPVMDLNLRFGHGAERYAVTDAVVVIEVDDLVMGLVVNEVLDVVSLPATAIEPRPRYDGEAAAPHFLAGEAKLGETIVMLLDTRALVHGHAPAPQLLAEEAPRAHPCYFCPQATPEERAVFHSRAVALLAPAERAETTGLAPHAVIGLNGECFGVALDAVREFCEVRAVAPVPCCPPRFVGQMNLRGDVLTLVDIREALGLPMSRETAGARALVVRDGELAAGVPVEQVFDVIHLRPADIAPAPAALHEPRNEYVTGVASYAGRMLCLIDLRKLLAEGGMAVEETVEPQPAAAG